MLIPRSAPKRVWVQVLLVLIVAASLVTANSFMYPTESPDELGWWGTTAGNVVGGVVGCIALPAIPVALTVGSVLEQLGVPETLALASATVLGSLFGAWIWSWVARVVVRWLGPRRAA